MRRTGTSSPRPPASARGRRWRHPGSGPVKTAGRRSGSLATRFTITIGGKLRLPKIGDVPVRWSRDLPSEPSSVTVIMDAAGRYFASFVVETGENPLPDAGTEVGIDLGLTHFAILSDGRKVNNPRFLRRAERRLRKAQQALSRKEKGSPDQGRAGTCPGS